MKSYEQLLSALHGMEKTLKDAVNTAARQQKALEKNAESGNLTEAGKNLSALRKF